MSGGARPPLPVPPRLVVIVAFGALAQLTACLNGLDPAERVVVVDNSSEPSISACCRERGLTYLDPGANLGFAAAVNRAVAHAGLNGGDLVLLNPDAVISSAALDALQVDLHAAYKPRTSCVAPQQQHPDGTLARVAWPFPSPRRMALEAVGMSRHAPDEFLIGSVLVIRGAAWEDVGPLDENFFLYAEEAQWQARAAWRGWAPGRVVNVTATHEGGATSTDRRRREQLFHAGQETFIRTEWGARGWRRYRLAALAGAGARSLVPRAVAPGVAGPARERVRIYRGQPRSEAGLPPLAPPVRLRITHVVVTSAFAGTERYVAQVASAQSRLGHLVTVIGGESARMSAELAPGVRWLPGGTVPLAIRSLLSAGHQHVVHAHLTAAEIAVLSTLLPADTLFVSTRHIAATRGSTLPARVLGRAVERRLDLQISISDFVAGAIGVPSQVLRNGTEPVDSGYDVASRVVLVAQRLEREKDTATAIRAFALSGLAGSGWRLVVAGDGTERSALCSLAESLGCLSSVEFLGQVADVGSLLSQAAFVVAPATAEPLGLTVLEAMARGVPVIASAAGGHLETLGAPSGLLFPVGDARAAAALLRDLAADASRRATLSASLRARQLAHFALAGHVDELLRSYLAADTMYA